MSLSDAQYEALQAYTACDISDALAKLKVPGSGFLPDLQSYSQPDAVVAPGAPITIAPASTVLFVPKEGTQQPAAAATTNVVAEPSLPPANIPKDTHWVDLTPPGAAVVIKQPDGQKNAVCGGIMAVRMKVCQAKAIVVAGRARDVDELRSTGLPIWARGLSTIGAGVLSTPWAIQVPLNIDDTVVNPGDFIFSDPTNGVVVIPKDLVDQVIELLPKLVAADDRVKEDVLKGMTVYEAFKTHRSGL